MAGSDKDNAGVVAHPPFIYLAGLVAGTGMELLAPLGQGAFAVVTWQVACGLAIVLAGAALLLFAARRFIVAGTNIPTHLPSTALVTTGLYRWTRNPIYVALTLIYLGLSICGGLWWALLLLPVVLVVMRYGVIAREEAYLSAKFGDDYTEYRNRVRRWL